jgi:predicted AlkP superfamily phosphohydrolase/phosphomutase
VNTNVSEKATKIFFLALDAVDADLIRGWASEGLLPTFRSLFERARWGVVDNVPGLYVGAVWTNFNTARSPANHGRYWFYQIRNGTYDIVRSRASDVHVDAFWDVLSRAGRRVAVIDAAETQTSEGLNGIQLVDWGTHSPEAPGFRTWPSSLASEVVSRFGRDPVRQCDRHVLAPDGFSTLRDGLLTRISRKEAIARHYLAQGEWDMFLAQFSEAHCAGHQFWRHHDVHYPGHAEAQPRRGDPLRDVYVAIDAAVGRLLSEVGPRTHVFVLCTHGMGPCIGANFLLDEVLARLQGVPLVKRRGPMDALLWLWQRLPRSLRARLALVRDPLVKRIDETRPIADSSRRCFQIPNNDGNGAVRINLRGREPAGRVTPGAEYDALCASLIRDLTTLRNAETGTPAVNRVMKIAEVCDGPNLASLPDLLVEWNREHPIRALVSEKTGLVTGVDPQNRTGDHKPDGLFFATGPGLAVGPLAGRVSIMDFAPTIATLLSVPLPGVEGKPIRELLPPLVAAD